MCQIQIQRYNIMVYNPVDNWSVLNNNNIITARARTGSESVDLFYRSSLWLIIILSSTPRIIPIGIPRYITNDIFYNLLVYIL